MAGGAGRARIEAAMPAHDQKRVLTGITTTGTPHLGNYVGAIRPALAEGGERVGDPYYFLADYHALVGCFEPQRVVRSTLEIAATWLALGLDTERAVFYRQSDVPEVAELAWLLSCVTAKGLMNRAHAYKSAAAANQAAGADPDHGVSMGLFNYPVLMAADILLFNASRVPVGRDQVQHLEMAREIAGRFNNRYGAHFVLPEAIVCDDIPTLPGNDGRKMSKSYDNTIPLWLPADLLRKAIMRIRTDSRAPGEPKDPDTSTVYQIYAAFAGPAQRESMRRAFVDGIAWSDAKEALFELVNSELAEPRERYWQLVDDSAAVEIALAEGAGKARASAAPFMAELRRAVGIRPLYAAR
ncbi:MAG TPA: tryptophan--tRNA ligase [Arenicellales bacterium]|nr:tryptophan--tRNA ligase [Arenicellales bacterium]